MDRGTSQAWAAATLAAREATTAPPPPRLPPPLSSAVVARDKAEAKGKKALRKSKDRAGLLQAQFSRALKNPLRRPKAPEGRLGRGRCCRCPPGPRRLPLGLGAPSATDRRQVANAPEGGRSPRCDLGCKSSTSCARMYILDGGHAAYILRGFGLAMLYAPLPCELMAGLPPAANAGRVNKWASGI